MSDDGVNVVTIHGGSADPRAGVPNDTVIEYLEELLERARSGDVQGIAGGYLDRDLVASYFVIGKAGTYGMTGALVCATNRVARIADGE